MENICPKEQCTACGACREVCPRHCINFATGIYGELNPDIDQSQCIDCGACVKTCPNNQTLNFVKPDKCYAAWSNDSKTRFESASGGVAAELYKYALKQGAFSVGVCWDRQRGAFYIPIQSEDDIEKVRNSKYVFSDTHSIYSLIKKKLEKGVSVLFIGLPCQIAGLYGFLKRNYEHLTTVDIICHGVAPTEYLEQHLTTIEKCTGCQADRISFRTPKYFTYTFTFTFADRNNKEFYKKTVKSSDNYQLGYHHALIYRENCYRCRYAKNERIADITIGDFSGLGRYAECKYDRHNVSCVLVNTIKGANLINNLKDVLTLDSRPMDEALKIEKQLQHPSIPHPERERFLRIYAKTQSFPHAANAALRGDKRQVVKNKIIEESKKVIRTMIPSGIMTLIRKK